MSTNTQSTSYGFALGMLTGTAVGAMVMLWLAPRAAGEVRQRIADSARAMGDHTSDRYQQIGKRVAATIDDLAAKGQAVRNDVADAVARGAHEVERFATAAKVPGGREL